MARSTGIVLAAGGISFANDWLQTDSPNVRIIVATLASALVINGVERLSPRAGVGLASLLLVTVLVAPVGRGRKTPAQTLLAWSMGKDTKK